MPSSDSGQRRSEHQTHCEQACLLLDLNGLTKRLPLSKKSVREMIRRPKDPLPAYKPNNKLIFKWSEVEAWLDRQRIQPVDVEGIVNVLFDRVNQSSQKRNRKAKTKPKGVQSVQDSRVV